MSNESTDDEWKPSCYDCEREFGKYAWMANKRRKLRLKQ